MNVLPRRSWMERGATLRGALAVLLAAFACGCGTGPENRGSGRPLERVSLASPEASPAAAAVLQRIERLGGRRVVGPGLVHRFEATSGGGHRARLEREPLDRGADVELPAVASGDVVVHDRRSGMAVRIALQTAADAPIEAARGLAVYQRALAGADVVQRVVPEGVEDFVAFHEPPARHEVTYSIEVSAAAGLRLVSSTLELVDDRGTPRLRMAPPYVVDREGRRHAVAVVLRGCEADGDPRAPWGRPTTAPGASRCDVVLRWAPTVQYPAVLDPLWSTTDLMTVPRELHEATALPDGRVLVTGGNQTDDLVDTVASADLLDPATLTWSPTQPMSEPRRAHAQLLLDADTVLVAGGGGQLLTAELYDIATGTWTPTAPLMQTHQAGGAVALGGGRAILFGGLLTPNAPKADAEIYDAASASWQPVASMLQARSSFGFAKLTIDGKDRVLASAGVSAGGQIATSELYDPVLDEWTLAGSVVAARSRHTLTTLADGSVLMVGGIKDSEPLDVVERFDPATLQWSLTAPMAYGRHSHTAALLPNGRLLAAGGCCGPTYPTAEIFDPLAGTWQSIADLPDGGRTGGGDVVMADGRVVITGGDHANTTGPFQDALVFALGDLGAACNVGAECDSGICAGGICCDAECRGACQACAAAAKGGGVDGICEAVTAGLPDPAGVCVEQAAGSCGTTGKCAAASVCEVHAAGTSCAAECPNGTVDSACDGAGACVCPGLLCEGHELVSLSGEVVDDCSPYLCEGDQCKQSCSSTADCLPPNLCDEDHRCVAPDVTATSSGSAEEDGGGCGCRLATRSTHGQLALLLATIALALQRRRREHP